MSLLTRSSPAKINLTLRVVGVRSDGFHEIESLVARVGLADTVRVAARDDGRLTLACDDPTVPCDDTNLAMRAARRLANVAGLRGHGTDIELEKRIPAGAGLGGGSSNAAATLALLNELWGLRLSPAELERIGGEIGSDVPLFSHTPVCVVRGRGQLVEDVRQPPAGWVVLLLPALHSATREVYAAWDALRAPVARPAIRDVLAETDDVERLMSLLFNELEAAAFAVSPALRRVADQLREVAGGEVRMTGSGSGFFRLSRERAPAEALASRVRSLLRIRAEVAELAS